LDYSNNCFSSIPSNFGENLGDAIYLDLSKNKLNGSIPASVCSLSKLQTLDLSHNYFSGFIPLCLVHQNLEILNLRGNQFHGVAPDNIREECMLQAIDLNSNYISGKLPRSLSNC
jgi:Leucine-rich repeat (LRR) protein